MELRISNINLPDNDFPFITANVEFQDTEVLGQGAVIHIVIDKGDDTMLMDIKDLALEQVRQFLARLQQEIEYK